MSGFVSLVGAGPGDAGLLTARAIRRLEQADVIVYDRLISPRALTFAKPSARCLYVGKEAGRHAMAQADINRLLSRLAEAGERVVRLKGGDPFVFGRGGEEAAQLTEDRIPFEVVPGVTSAISAPAYAGIPVTHRNAATGFSVITGHVADEKNVTDADWQMLADANRTIVFLMGVAHLHAIVERLFAAGRPEDTPAAVIQSGTRAAQKTVVGTLANIEAQVKAAGIISPAVIVIGNVVQVSDLAAWAEARPLFGLRLVVASDERETARDLADFYEDAGAEVVDFSVEYCIEQGVQRTDGAVQAIWNLMDGRFDAAVYTSPGALSWLRRSLERTHPELCPVRQIAQSQAAISHLVALRADDPNRSVVFAT